MLLVSTRLGLIACRYMAEHYDADRWITASEIAGHYHINVRSLMPTLRKLVRADILHSRVGGSSSGFVFARSPEKVMLSEVMNALEGSATLYCCKDLIKGLECNCADRSECKIYGLFSDIVNTTILRYQQTSIAEFVESGIDGLK